MANSLFLRLLAAKQNGADTHTVLSQILHEKCRSDSRVCGIAFTFWLAATLVFAIAAAALVLGNTVGSIPVLSQLGSIDDGHLQALATACAIISSVLFMIFLRLRQEQTKHTFLLVLVIDGNVSDAAKLLFGHKVGKAEFAMDTVDAVFGALG